MKKKLKWNKYTINTTTDAADLISGMLIELGINGIEIEDKLQLSQADKEKLFINILPEMEDDGISLISFYTDEQAENDLLLDVKNGIEEIRAFANVGEGSIVMSTTEDKDWINNWKKFFKPFMVDDILIKPTWEKADQEAKIVIDIDPGTVFGTGMHETTQLCIRQVRKYVTEDTEILDVGCGSGILSIAGLKLGAKSATCIDIDEAVEPYVKENMQVNLINEDKYKILIGDVLGNNLLRDKIGYESYDMVVANILADVIIPLVEIITPHMKKGALLITSGIINSKESQVNSAIMNNKNLEVLEITKQGEWVSITAKRV